MDEQGTPAILRYGQETISHSIDDQVLIRQAAIGVHSTSVRYRSGSIHIGRHPSANGAEPVGMVALVDPGIRGIHLGDRGPDQFAMVRKASVVTRIISDHIPERGGLDRSTATAHADLGRRRSTGPVVIAPVPHEV